jgi:hypothetical protein
LLVHVACGTSLPGAKAHNEGESEIKCESNEVVYMSTTNEGKQLPQIKFNAGAISATVWENSGTSKAGEPVSFNTIQVSRGYKDKEGNWQNTTSLRINDLPRVALVLQKAYEHLVLKDQETGLPSSVSQNMVRDQKLAQTGVAY